MASSEIKFDKANISHAGNLAEHNPWLWKSRWTHLQLRDVSTGTGYSSDIMEPTFFQAKSRDDVMRQVAALKKAGINSVLTEGVRHLIRYEQGGRTDEVIAAIRMATELCHEAGIKVIHHTTTTFAGHHVEEFPEHQQAWLSLDAQTGKPSYIAWEGGWHLWCINNPEFRAEYFRLCKKVLAETGVDGLMTDEVYFRANGWYTCACGHCQEKYRQASGQSLPAGDDASFWGHFDNEAFRTWLRMRSDSVGEFYADLSQEISKVHPNPVFLGCSNHEEDPAQTAMFGDSNQGRMRGGNLLFFEVYEGPVASVLYSWRRMAASFMAYNGLTNYYGTPTMSLMVIPNFKEAFFSWALQSAHGTRVWATGPRCLAADLPPEECALYGELFDWEKSHEAELVGAYQPLANIGVLFSTSTRNMMMAHWGPGDAAPVSNGDWADIWFYYANEWVGWCEALTDAHLQYAVPTEQEISVAALQRYSLVILPDTTCLSDSACQALLDYVAEGGCVITTGKTGMCDETGSASPVNRLEALGVRLDKTTDEAQQPPVFGTHKQGRWAYFNNRPGATTYLESNKQGAPRCKSGPSFPVIPDDVREFQRSLMIQAVDWAIRGEQPLTVKQAPEGILIKAFLQQKGDSSPVVIHLLNCRGDGAIAYGEVIPAEYLIDYPALNEDIILQLRLDAITGAYVISPDSEGKQPVMVERGTEGFELTIPAGALKRYSVVYVERSAEI